MNLSDAGGVATVLVALVFGVALPVLAMRALVPAAAGGPLERANYRGTLVSASLGLVWLVWALAPLAGQAVLDAMAGLPPWAGSALVERLATTPLGLPLFAVPFLLVSGVVALGLADDAFGGAGPKGFAGHLGALKGGRLTTGMLKMLGIGVIALFYGASAAPRIIERSGVTAEAAGAGWLSLLAWALATATIALSANLLNLLDLRPGRALKVYSVLVIVPAIAYARAVIAAYSDSVAPFAGPGSDLLLGQAEAIAVQAAIVVMLLGPVVAVWRYDLGERAMLGDAGANTMGAIVGFLLTAVLPLSGLAAAAAVLLVLNLISERVSFTRVIDHVGVLSWLDRLGRTSDGPAHGASVRYHSNEDPRPRED